MRQSNHSRLLARTVVAAVALHSAGLAGAKVASIPLAELVERSDLVALVEVAAVKRGTAQAEVLEVWKGAVGEHLKFAARPTWTCDISGAEVGETAILFLVRGRWGVYRIAHSGRGRMPVREVDGQSYATVWIGDVKVPDGIPTVAGPEPEYSFIRSVPLEEFKRLAVDRADSEVDQ